MATSAMGGIGQGQPVQIGSRTYTTLDQLEAALRRYISDVSHDLRSPITAIRLSLEEALMHPAETQWPQIAAKVLDDVDRLLAVVCDLCSVDAIGAGIPQPRPDRPR